MESGFQYQDLMSAAIADNTRDVTQQKEQFEEKLQEVQEKKGMIGEITNLATVPFEARIAKEGLTAIGKGLDKLSGGKVTEFNNYINNKFARAKTNAENQISKIKEKAGSSEDASPESDEQAPQEIETAEPIETSEGVELQDASSFGEIEPLEVPPTQEELMATMEERRAQQPSIETEDLPEGAGERVQPSGEASDIDTTTVEQSAQDATADAGASASESSAVSAGEGAAAAAGETAAAETAEETAGAALLDDPFTFFFGLALTIGGAVGGIEGSRAVKNPSVPKPAPIPNVSTQYGV